MSKSMRVRESDLRAVLRLGRELSEVSDADGSGRFMHMVKRTCELVGARAAVAVVTEGIGTPERRGVWTDAVGLEASDVRLAQEIYTAGGGPPDPAEPAYFERAVKEPGPVVALTRRQILGDRAWYGSAHYGEVRRAIRLDDFLYVGVWASATRLAGMGLNREIGARPFTARDRRLVEILNEGCRWVYEGPGPTSGRAAGEGSLAGRLSPRQCAVLERLLAGDSEKQAARRLGLSVHTVHDHVKALYRRLGVGSRGELMARWVK